MKIRLLGRTGQVARALAGRLGLEGVSRQELDFEKPELLSGYVTSDTDIVINAVAYTAVDAAEDDRERAFRVNAEAVGWIGELARKNDVLVVHYSTDYVFDGAGRLAYSENQLPHPLSVYGASKLEGERRLIASGARHLIFRTSWVYSAEGTNFPLTILRLAKERETLDVVVDQVGAPTSAALIADITGRCLKAGLEGLYHLAPSGETSWYDYARFVVAEAQAAGAALKLRPEQIRPIPSTAYPTRAQRPANSRLDTGKLRTALGMTPPPWQEGARQLIRTLRDEGRL